MGATGLYAYLNNKAAGSAQHTTLRPDPSAHDGRHAEDCAQPPPPLRVVLIDAQSLYHHLLYKYFPYAARSTGGDFRAMHAAAAQFLAPFMQTDLRVAVAAVFDGAASSSEGKSATRRQRARDRRSKMKRFDIAARMRLGSSEGDSAPLPLGCVELNVREECLLPVPAGCLLAFRQSLHALGISTWNADGENDEYLAALAVGIAAEARKEGSSVDVDIIGQDSDFLVFDTRVNEDDTVTVAAPAAASSSSARSSPSSSSAAQDDACAYVPLDSLRFEPLDSDEDSEDSTGAFSISFRRYTTSAVCSALKLPPCLLPSVACLVGNDSALDLAHFHCFTHSGSFHKLVREASGGSGSGGGAGVLNNNRFAALTAGKGSRNTNASSVEFNGGFNTSSQLVEAVLAFVSSVARSHGSSAGGSISAKQHRDHLDAMNQVIQRMFGEDASLARGPASSSTSSSDPVRSSALDSFRRAQLKYSLDRFFAPQHCGSADASSELLEHYGLFDAGFAVDSDASNAAAASTAILLPRPLLALYHSAHLSPVLLSIMLTRHYVSHVSLGDVVHPCVFHTQRAAASGEVEEGGVCARASWESSSDDCFCWSAAECTTGVRRRIYQLLLMDPAADFTPRSLPSTGSPSTDSGMGASMSALFSTIGRGMASLFRAAPDASSSASCSSSDAAPSGSAGSSAESMTIWECINVASVSDRSSIDEDADESTPANEHTAAGGERWVEVELTLADTTAVLSTISDAVKAVSQLEPLPSLFPELAGKQDQDWMTLLALLDNVADLPLAAASKLPAPSARAVALRSSFSGLVQLHSPLAVFALVVRQVFLHSLAPLLAHRFEPPAIGAKLDATIHAQMRRAIVGVNALVIQATMMMLQSSNEPAEEEDPKSEYLSLEALSLSQLFIECYHWTEYAVQTTRLRSHLRLAQAEAACASPTSSIAAHSSSLLPLFRCFDGALFHRIYVQLLQAMEQTVEPKGGKKKSKTAAAKSSHAASSGSSTSAAASSKSVPDFSLCSPALSHVLLDLDAAVADATESVLSKNLGGVDAASVSQTRSLISALKSALLGSIGLGSPAPSVLDASLAETLAQSIVHESTHHVQPRFVLPFETIQAEPSGASRSPTDGSTFFSLCSAAVPAPSASPPCASCGLRGVHVPHPSASPSPDDGSGSDVADSKAASKGKRKRKTKGKSKR